MVARTMSGGRHISTGLAEAHVGGPARRAVVEYPGRPTSSDSTRVCPTTRRQ